jgi:hypothetical protein
MSRPIGFDWAELCWNLRYRNGGVLGLVSGRFGYLLGTTSSSLCHGIWQYRVRDNTRFPPR